ncbi:MAG: M1 family metallopeptidase [Terracoccus sp.]
MPAIPGDPYVPGRGDATYEVRHYDLDLDYKVSSNRLSGRARLDVVAVDALRQLRVDLVGLRVSKVTADGVSTRWSQRAGHLTVTLPGALAPGDGARLAITYSGNPGPTRSTWGELGWEELEDGVLVASQPTGAPTWFPCNDHPRSKATYRISLECDSPYAVSVTGTLTGRRVRGSRTRHVFDEPYPMATYLACVHVGHYERVVLADDGVRQVVVAPRELHEQVLRELEPQPRMMELFVDLFGPYPFDDYTVVVTSDDLEIPLEAQAMATFGPNWLDGRGTHERLVAHELAHQWFGNSLTVATWSDIWLNEGFACYAEWLWSDASGGPTADELAAQHRSLLARGGQDFILADPGPERMFDDCVYKRGALTLHALRRHLGEEVFASLLRSWVSTHRHGSVSTADFVAHVSDHDPSGRAVDLVRDWVMRLELPTLVRAARP